MEMKHSQNIFFYLVKVSPDFVTNITDRSIGLVEILVIMYVLAFKSDVILYGVVLVYGV
jgi:hypothetical protein